MEEDKAGGTEYSTSGTRFHHDTQLAPCPCVHNSGNHLVPMFSTGKRCDYCSRPLGFGLYRFCCNNCQRCWHRERGTCPSNRDMRSFRQFCREHAAELNAHARDVALHGPNHHSQV